MLRTSSEPASKLEDLPTGHSDRIMSVRLPLKNNCSMQRFLVYMLRLFKLSQQKKISFTQNFAAFSKAPLQTTNRYFLETSMLGWAKTQLPGKEYLADMALETATIRGAYCWSSAWKNNLSSPTR